MRGTRLRRPRQINLVVGGLLVLVLVLAGLISLIWTPVDPARIRVVDRLAAPSGAHLLGTDQLGRDTFSQLMTGARHSFVVAVLATGASLLPGIALGLVAATRAGLIDQVVMRLADVFLGLPGVLIALILATIMGPGGITVIIALAVWFVPSVTRLVRGPAKQILGTDYVSAAIGYGRRRPFIIVRHVIPNVLPLIIVQTSIMFALAILADAGLSYLGVGAPRPAVSWGLMLNESQTFASTHPLQAVFPGLAILLAVLGFNLLGDGLRARLDPRQRPAGGTI
jgi:peptide/nickel transport system permease protein